MKETSEILYKRIEGIDEIISELKQRRDFLHAELRKTEIETEICRCGKPFRKAGLSGNDVILVCSKGCGQWKKVDNYGEKH